MAEHGITVNAVAPNLVRAPTTEPGPAVFITGQTFFADGGLVRS